MRTVRPSNRLSPDAYILLIVMTILWTALGSRITPGARQHDFLNLYTGGTLTLHGAGPDTYDPFVQFKTETQLVPTLRTVVPFVRPPFYGIPLALLALISFPVAFVVWLGVQIVVFLICLGWGWWRWGSTALTFGAMFLPATLGIASGQDCVFMIAIIIGVWSLQERGFDFGAGAVLGLGLIKFHLFLLWPVLLILQKRWRVFAGSCSIVAVELSLSLVLVGPRGLLNYLSLLRNPGIERLNPSPELMINVHALALNLGTQNFAVRGCLVLLVLVLSALACSRLSFTRSVAVVSIGSLLIAPHVFGYDAALLLPGLWYILFQSRSTSPKLLASFLCSPVPYLMNLAGPHWGAVTPLALLILLALLARDSLRLPSQAAIMLN